ncbi:MAG TPA: hypothetical protein VJB96_05030 [Patescibacteria group bacterium]|nr:hypothetical protein [Patescibacteria group bacterium]
MSETIIGARAKDIVHQKLTPEGSLTITHNTRDFLANTVGHVLAVPTIHAGLWTLGSAFKNPSAELAGQLFERYKNVPWKGDVLVRVGQANLTGDIVRILAKNEDIRGRPWMLKGKLGRGIEYVGKLGVALLTTIQAFGNRLLRNDFYNPFANTVTVFHPRLAVGMHELGHAEFFNQMDRRRRTGYVAAMANTLVYLPFFRSRIEWAATANAMKHYVSDVERRNALKIHEAAWATYLVRDALVSLAFLVPALALPLLNTPAWAISLKAALGTKAWALSFGIPLSFYGATLAGHAMNRLYPKKRERFGYIFSGETKPGSRQVDAAPPSSKATEGKPEKPRELSPHQVLVATARAPKPAHTQSNSHRILF